MACPEAPAEAFGHPLTAMVSNLKQSFERMTDEDRHALRAMSKVLAHLKAITARDRTPLGAHIRSEIRNLTSRDRRASELLNLSGDGHKDRIVLDLLRRQVAEQTAKAKTGGAK